MVVIWVGVFVREIQASEQAFAALLQDGSAVTWGLATLNLHQGNDITALQATDKLFAGILEDGSLVRLV